MRIAPSTLLRLVPVAVLAAIAVVVMGCSAEVSIGDRDGASGEEIADDIRADYEDQTGVALRSLTCEDIEGDEAETFNCSARNENGFHLEIDGEVTDSDAGRFHWEVTEVIAPGVYYERALRRELESRGIAIKEIRCPVEIEADVGAEIRCTATDGDGDSAGVTLRLTDEAGRFDYSVDGHSPEADGHGAPEESGGSGSSGTRS
ncbi:MAG: DUF4333 domain-containing protein [Solirubrobacterales bacterium]